VKLILISVEAKLEIEALAKQLKSLDRQIEEVKKRLPAHSVKPPIMMELLELEDERDAVLAKLAELKPEK
jgi:hypothetical protein